MRILHTCLRYPPATGGVETYIGDIVKLTRNVEAGRDVRVLTSTMKTHGPITYLAPGRLQNDPIYVQRLSGVRTLFISYPRLRSLKYYIKHHNPDIIHGHGFWYQPADVASRYAKRHTIPFFFHPMYYEYGVRLKPVWQIYKSTIGKKTFSYADVVIVISPFERSRIEAAGLPVKRFELIPPGIDLKRYERRVPNPFLSRNITGTVILSVCRLDPEKGIDDVIRVLPEIVRSHHDVTYVVIGEDFGYKEKLMSMAKKYGVEKRIHFLGYVKNHELIGAYQHASLYVHPSHYEAFGIAIAESIAAGTPVVARNVGSIPYVAPHDVAALLFNTSKSMASNIARLLDQTELRSQLISGGKKYVRDNFSSENSIKKLTDLYSEFGHKEL